MMRTVIAAYAAVVALSAAVDANAQIEDPVVLDAGRIRGADTEVEGIRVFRGIPFAAAPVDELRWRMPRPVDSWRGVRDATRFGNICIQPPGRGRLNVAVLPESPPMSEDCLYLNVWTPAESTSDSLAVMVHFYGGAWTEGAGSVPLYDGTALAEKGVIVVTMNYRLGPFGFFAHPALRASADTNSSGNYGLGDKIAALQWVQDNIRSFGGDPENVTVFGQSAGAASIGALVAAPRATGLFHRAIAESGTWMGLGPSNSMRSRESAEESGIEQAAEVGVSSAEALRALSADEVVRHLRGAGVIVDGWVVPEDPNVVYAQGRQNAVDVLTGSNKNDSFFPGAPDLDAFTSRMTDQWGDLAPRYFELYPAATGEDAAAMSTRTSNDGTFWISRIFAEYQRKLARQAWVYLFAQNPRAATAKTSLRRMPLKCLTCLTTWVSCRCSRTEARPIGRRIPAAMRASPSRFRPTGRISQRPEIPMVPACRGGRSIPGSMRSQQSSWMPNPRPSRCLRSSGCSCSTRSTTIVT